jgi:hypothetical protein
MNGGNGMKRPLCDAGDQHLNRFLTYFQVARECGVS